MASQISIDFTTASGMLATAIGRIDEGGAGTLKGYSGTTVPTNVSESNAGDILLFECPFSASSFGAITDQNPNAQATANTVTADTSANATGTCNYFRIENGNSEEVLQGSAGEAADSTDMTLDDKNIVLGNLVGASTITLTQPEA